MNFNWELYICLACKLTKSDEASPLYEASLRTAISRSYYGVYGVATTYLLDAKNIPDIPRKDSHKYVREQFRCSTDRREVLIGENMSRLWKGRQNADYDDDFCVDSSEAVRHLEIAKATISELNKLHQINNRH